jgi:hypothetical protein
MSDLIRPFAPKDEAPIPHWPLPVPPPSKEDRVYVIGMEATNRRLQYYFVERPPVPDPAGDGPLLIRVPNDCTIVLRLSPDWNWEFRHTDAVMLGPIKIPEKPRYFNLTPTIVDGRCMEVKFNALCLNEGDKGNRDPYALYINVDHDAPDSLTVPLLVRIDPDIDNPGTRPV